MSDARQTLLVRAHVELTPETLQAIVQNAKEITGPDEKGVYRVDTAEMVSEMITKFDAFAETRSRAAGDDITC